MEEAHVSVRFAYGSEWAQFDSFVDWRGGNHCCLSWHTLLPLDGFRSPIVSTRYSQRSRTWQDLRCIAVCTDTTFLDCRRPKAIKTLKVNSRPIRSVIFTLILLKFRLRKVSYIFTSQSIGPANLRSYSLFKKQEEHLHQHSLKLWSWLFHIKSIPFLPIMGSGSPFRHATLRGTLLVMWRICLTCVVKKTASSIGCPRLSIRGRTDRLNGWTGPSKKRRLNASTTRTIFDSKTTSMTLSKHTILADD